MATKVQRIMTQPIVRARRAPNVAHRRIARGVVLFHRPCFPRAG